MPSIQITTWRRSSAAALVASLALLGLSLAAENADKPETAEQKLLRIVSTESGFVIRQTYDLDTELVQKIMAHRRSGKTFTTIEDLIEVTGLSPARAATIAESGGRKPETKKEAPGRRARRPAAAPPREGANGGTPLVSNVRPFYGKLPGYEDLDKLDPVLKKEFLERMNYEMCPCGCENETLAFCLVNDPACPVVKARARKIYEEVLSKAAQKPAEEDRE